MSLTKQQATALYVAVYNRAPDAAGLTYWTTSFNGTYAEAAAGFVGHSQFQNEYGGLSNEETIEKFYTNMLGSAGDAEGIAFWTAQLDDGATEAEVLASFLDATLSYAGNDAAALTRQATLENKVEVGIFFAETLGDASNPTSADLNNDPAYLRSIEAIAGVTADDATVAAAQEQINSWVVDPVDPVDPEVEGQTFFLTEGADRDVNAADGFIKGTDDNDTFIADIVQNQSGQQVNTLGTGDRLDGGNGTDTLDAQVTAGAYAGGDANMAIQARTKSIENVKLEAVHNIADSRDSDDVFVNAKDMEGVRYIGSERSNADLIIQDLTSKGVAGGTADMTIGMKYTNNDDTRWTESDLEVYFDQDYLLRKTTFSEPTVNIQLMNEDAYSATNGEFPLAGVYLRELTITVNGEKFDLTQYIEEDVAGNGEEIRTYEELLTAIQGAIVELKADHPNNAPLQSLEASMGPLFEADIDPQNGLARIGNSISITVDGETNGVENTLNVQATDLELGRTSGTQYENNNRYERADNDPAVEAEDLVTVGVELEKVGRAGDGGDLIIGSMNKDSTNTWSNEDEIGVGTVSGVERFNVTVDGGKTESSSLASLRSTNNNLREVNVKSADGSNANLTIGNSNSDSLFGLDKASALKDVQTFNAAEFNGDLTLHAALTGEVTEKYLQNGSAAEDFVYTGGIGNDTFDIALSAANFEEWGNATHGDFNFEINSGAGNDAITVGIYDFGLANAQSGAAPWLLNQKTNANLSINAGEGDDAVNLQGSGDWDVNLGAGADVIYVDNAGTPGENGKASWIFNIDPSKSDAVLTNAKANLDAAEAAQTAALNAQTVANTALATAVGTAEAAVPVAATALTTAVTGAQTTLAGATATQALATLALTGVEAAVNAAVEAAEKAEVDAAEVTAVTDALAALNTAITAATYDVAVVDAALVTLQTATSDLGNSLDVKATDLAFGINTAQWDLDFALNSYDPALEWTVEWLEDAETAFTEALDAAGNVFSSDSVLTAALTNAQDAANAAVDATDSVFEANAAYNDAFDDYTEVQYAVDNANNADFGYWANVVGGGNSTYNLYKAGITLTLDDNLGGEFELNLSVNPDVGQYRTSQKAINEAIKKAIAEDPLFSKLVEAKTGQMADTLIIDSLIDGEDVNLDISVVQLQSGATAAQITAFNNKFGAGINSSGLANAYNSDLNPNVPSATAANNAFNGAQKATAEGTDGITYGEQTITGGTGDDIFVLGTSDNQEHTLVYNGYGNGKDTILNFADNVDALNLKSYNAKFVDFGSYNANGDWVEAGANADIGAGPTATATATDAFKVGDTFLRVVENQVEGIYKVEAFEVTSAGNVSAAKVTDTGAANITALGTVGTLDFGIDQTFNVDNFLI